MYYEDVFRELNKRKVRYLVVGGIAVNLYGVPRATMDLDLMVDTEEENLLKFVDAIEEIGYRPRVPVKAKTLADPAKRKEWQQKKHMVAFSFYRPELPYQEVDIFLNNPIDFNEASKTRKFVIAEGIRIPLISLDNLIKADSQQKRGFRYRYSRETIEKYRKLPAKMKLQWLEEINRFSFHAMPRKNRRIWEQFRRGEI